MTTKQLEALKDYVTATAKYEAANLKDPECCNGEYKDMCQAEKLFDAAFEIRIGMGEAEAAPADARPAPPWYKVEKDELTKALAPLVAIADAYEKSALDEARPEWDTQKGVLELSKTELFNGRGGKSLLTLGHCFAAREVVRKTKGL